MRQLKWLGLWLVVAALASGCTDHFGKSGCCGCKSGSGPDAEATGSSENESSSTGSTGDNGQYVSLNADGEWGTVSGQVVWEGTLPERAEIDVSNNPDGPTCIAKGKLYDEKWIVNKDNKGVRWVFVWLQPDGSGEMPVHPTLAKPDKEEVALDQPCCQFVDHAFAMRAGQALIAKNSSSLGHNVKWFNKDNGEGNVIVPAGRSLKIFDKMKASVRPMSIECNIHGWMKCWVRIFDHPYYAVTDENGKFEMKLAPAGKYRLIVWNEEGWGPDGKDGTPITIKGETDAGKIVINASK